ncbi:MAG TPA: fibronectin type III domain-containing protein [Candidatus Paceibacterota bacterium]|jgi:chitodextrinase|nr:fibronectin type III domain-containing protein [Candidatus Paceibacterota bacterium]
MTKVLRWSLFSLTIFAAMAAANVHAQVDTTPPSVPGAPSASVSNYNSVQVSWAASTDNVAVTGYYVYRNGAEVASTAGTSYTDTVPPGGAYIYTVAAYDAAGNVSRQSQESDIVSVILDKTPPTAPTGLTASVTTSSITLSWAASTDNVGVIGYYMTKNGRSLTLSTTGPYNSTSYTDSTVQPGTTYSYSIAAYDAAGNVSDYVSITTSTLTANFNPPDTTPPSPPAFLVATASSSTEIDIRWQASNDNVGVTGYYVYRNGSQVASIGTSTTSYADTGLTAGTGYSYTIAAYDAAGNVSAQSAAMSATTLPLDVIAPTVPKDLIALPVSVSSVMLEWQPSLDNVGVAGYYVYRNGTQIATVATTAYLDTGLASSTMYTYEVAAYDAAGNVSAQTFTSVNTPAVNPAVTPTPIPGATVTPPPLATPTPSTPGSVSGTSPSVYFTTTLAYGARSATVTALQNLLIENGYLGPEYATGFYGSLTQAAVQKFQCVQEVVCSGAPATTGWGLVGPKTRKALNAL